jgi:hypothetical protein
LPPIGGRVGRKRQTNPTPSFFYDNPLQINLVYDQDWMHDPCPYAALGGFRHWKTQHYRNLLYLVHDDGWFLDLIFDYDHGSFFVQMSFVDSMNSFHIECLTQAYVTHHPMLNAFRRTWDTTHLRKAEREGTFVPTWKGDESYPWEYCPGIWSVAFILKGNYACG